MSINIYSCLLLVFCRTLSCIYCCVCVCFCVFYDSTGMALSVKASFFLLPTLQFKLPCHSCIHSPAINSGSVTSTQTCIHIILFVFVFKLGGDHIPSLRQLLDPLCSPWNPSGPSMSHLPTYTASCLETLHPLTTSLIVLQ